MKRHVLPNPYMCPTCGWGRAVRTKPGKNRRAYVAGVGAMLRGYYRRTELPRPIRVYWPLSAGWRGDQPWRTCPNPWHKRGRDMRLPGYGKPAEMTTTLNLHDPAVTTRAKTRAVRHKTHQSKDNR